MAGVAFLVDGLCGVGGCYFVVLQKTNAIMLLAAHTFQTRALMPPVRLFPASFCFVLSG